jgi:hypothetical protein
VSGVISIISIKVIIASMSAKHPRTREASQFVGTGRQVINSNRPRRTPHQQQSADSKKCSDGEPTTVGPKPKRHSRDCGHKQSNPEPPANAFHDVQRSRAA